MFNKNNVYNKIILFSIGSTQEARMLIQDYKGYPRVSVFVRDKGTKNKAVSKINFAINKQGLYVIVNALEKMLYKRKETSTTIQMFSPVWVDDKQTNDIKEVGKLTVGKKEIDKQFITYFKVESNMGLKFSFKVLPSPYVKIFKDDTLLQGEALSEVWAESYCTMLKGILDLSLEAHDETTSLDSAVKSKVINNIDKELEAI